MLLRIGLGIRVRNRVMVGVRVRFMQWGSFVVPGFVSFGVVGPDFENFISPWRQQHKTITYKSKHKEHKTQHKHTIKIVIKKLQTNYNEKVLDNSSSEANAF